MSKISKPVLMLVVLAIVAVLGSLATLTAVMLKGPAGPRSDSDAPAVATQPEPQATSADPSASRSPSPRNVTTSKRGPVVADSSGPAPLPPPGDPAKRVERTWRGRELVTRTGSRADDLLKATPGISGKVGSLPAAVKTHSLSLDDGQKAALAQFEETFQTNMETTTEHNERAMKEALAGLQAAMETGNEQLIEQAKVQMQGIAQGQATAMDQLNEAYLNGVRGFLTPEQVAEVEKVLKQKTPAAYGYSTTTSADGTVKVEAVAPGSITVHSSTDDGH